MRLLDVIVTRLTRLIQDLILKNKNYFRFLGKFLSTNLICLFGGFYIGGNLAPVLSLFFTQIYMLNQSLFCLIFICFFELLNCYFLKFSEKFSNLRICFMHLRTLKQGILLGVFVDSFKVGS